MAFFKFRKGADESASASVQPQSPEAIRQRAKYRLAGAVVLVLAGVIGLPLLFDQQPRPMAVDLPVVIPDKNKVAPLVIPPAPSRATPPAPAPSPGNAQASAPATPQPVVATAPPEAQPLKAAPAPQALAKPAVGGVATSPTTSAAPAAPAPVNRAQALLDGQADNPKATPTPGAKAPSEPNAAPVPAVKPVAASEERFVVQVGAFADNARAREVRLKVERAGLKTYTHVAETKDGRRIRVRVGPFTSRAEAERAADKIRKLNLPVALLSL